MNVAISHKVVSVILSFLVLFSTLSLKVEKHYCGEYLIDTAIFSKAKSCGMEMANNSKMSLKKSCCKDVIDIIEGQDDLSLASLDDLDLSQQQFIASYIFSYTSLFESLPKAIIPHKDYSPPNIIKDIQVLDETFLI